MERTRLAELVAVVEDLAVENEAAKYVLEHYTRAGENWRTLLGAASRSEGTKSRVTLLFDGAYQDALSVSSTVETDRVLLSLQEAVEAIRFPVTPRKSEDAL